jgi:hypothetical protein
MRDRLLAKVQCASAAVDYAMTSAWTEVQLRVPGDDVDMPDEQVQKVREEMREAGRAMMRALALIAGGERP